MDTESKGFNDRLEIAIAILLGLAAVLTAVVGFQGSLRDGDSIKSFNEGIRASNDANGFYNDASQTFGRDQQTFLEYAKAVQSGDDDLTTYLHDGIMDDNLRAAVDDWAKPENDIASPLDSDLYKTPDADQGEKLAKETDQKFAEARALDDEGDKFNLVGVITASSLFFLGIAGVMSARRTKLAGVSLGAITLVVSIVMWLTV